jgi:hypothetical protein
MDDMPQTSEQPSENLYFKTRSQTLPAFLVVYPPAITGLGVDLLRERITESPAAFDLFSK